MTRKLTLLALLIIVLSVGALHAIDPATGAARSVGPELETTLEQLKELLTGGELDVALAKARKAASRPNLTSYETYVIQALIASVLINMQKYGEAAVALDASLSTGQVPDTDVPGQIKAIAALNYNAGEYQRSIQAGKRFFDATGTEKDVQILVMIAQSHFNLKSYAAASRRIQTAIVEADVTDEKVDKRWVLLWIASEYETGNAKGAANALKEFAKRFPDANYQLEWRKFPLLQGYPPVSL
jgi:tetratricopeptide (TPR) repeat protein